MIFLFKLVSFGMLVATAMLLTTAARMAASSWVNNVDAVIKAAGLE